MKKITKIFFCIMIIAGGLYFVNSYYDNVITQQIEGLFTPPVETTVKIHSTQTDKAPTIAQQVYKQLTDDEKKAFDNIYDALSKCRPSTVIYSNIETERIFDIVELVAAQHPEIFWWNGNCSVSAGSILRFDYTYSREEVDKINNEITSKAKEILEQIDPQGDDFEKSLAIFDYIILSTSYNNDAIGNIEKYPQSSTIEGVFLHNSAICSGYAKAYQYLLNMAGVDCIYVSGTAQTPNGTDGHAWILQEVGGFYYYTDPTWGDSYEASGNNDFISHTYFCTTSDEINKTHTCDEKCYKSFVTANDCNSYFKRKNLQFEQYDFNNIKSVVKNEFKDNHIGIEIKFETQEEYNTAIKELFVNEDIYYILLSTDLLSKNIDTATLSYNNDDTHNVIAIVYSKKF